MIFTSHLSATRARAGLAAALTGNFAAWTGSGGAAGTFGTGARASRGAAGGMSGHGGAPSGVRACL